MTNILLQHIRIDGGTQTRERLNQDVINDYAELMVTGVEFPPITLYYDGSDYWLADGFHRYAATAIAKSMAGVVAAEIRQGTRRDAVLFAVGANAVHGLRRTNNDKRRAVDVLLRDEEWSTWSDRAIAQKCGVSHQLVANLRQDMQLQHKNQVSTVDTCSKPSKLNQRVGQDGKNYPALKFQTRTTPKYQTEATQLEIDFQLDANELRIVGTWDSVSLTYEQALRLLNYLESIRYKLRQKVAEAC
jgi:hypothetical protein